MARETAAERDRRLANERIETMEKVAVSQAHIGQTTDERYQSGINGLCQKLDRILSGESELTVTSGDSTLSPAMTQFGKRTRVSLNHEWITKWVKRDASMAVDLEDRISLTLALNLHELGHVLFTPRVSGQGHYGYEGQMLMNALEDQRQEMLVTREYPKAADYFRICNTRALRESLQTCIKEGRPVPHQLLLLYYGRRHLFPKDINVLLVRSFLEATDIATADLSKYTQENLEFVKRKIKEFMALPMASDIDTSRGWGIVVDLLPYWTRANNSQLKPFNENCLPSEGEALRSPKERVAATKDAEQARAKQAGREQAETEQASKPQAGKPKSEPKQEEQEPEQAESEESEGAEPMQAPESPEDEAPESNESEGAGADSESEGEGEGEGGEESDGNAEGDTGEFTDEESTEEESESGGPGQGGGKGGDEITPDNEIGEQSALEEALQELVESEAESQEKVSTEVQDYGKSVFTSDKISLPASLQATAQNLARLLEDISTDLKEQNFRNQPSGRFDLHGLAGKLASGSDKLFYRKQNDMSPEAAMGIHITVDISGSMRNTVDRAMMAAYTIAKAAEMSNHMTRISAFNNNVVQVKGWHSTRVTLPQAGGDTQPLEIFHSALRDFRMLEDKEGIHNHALIVITDGGWGQAPECQREIAKLRKAGVYVILIGIDYMPQYLGKGYEDTYATLVVRDVTGLATVLRETLKKLSIQVSHDALRKSW